MQETGSITYVPEQARRQETSSACTWRRKHGISESNKLGNVRCAYYFRRVWSLIVPRCKDNLCKLNYHGKLSNTVTLSNKDTNCNGEKSG